MPAPTLLSFAEDDELRRRKVAWCYYLMRNPVFALATLRAARGVEGALGRVPLLGFAVRYGLEMLLYWQRIYFYCAAS